MDPTVSGKGDFRVVYYVLCIFVHVFGCLLLSASHDNNVCIFEFKYVKNLKC